MSKYSTIFLTFIVLLSFTPLSAQHLSVETAELQYQEENRPCIRIEMEPKPKAVKKAWDDYLKENHDVNLKGIGFLVNKDVLSAEEIRFSLISEEPMDLYTRVVAENERTEMSVFARLGKDQFLDPESHPLGFSRLQQVVESFLGDYLPEHYGELVTKAEEELEDLLDQQKELMDEVADNKREIAELEKENREKSKTLIDINAMIEDLQEKVEANRKSMRQVDRKLREYRQ